MEEIFYDENGKTLEEVTQRGVDVPTLELFKVMLNGALRNQI